MAENGNASVTVLAEAYFIKSCPLRKALITWTKRWFVLEEVKEGDEIRTQLSYYKDERKKTIKGRVPLDRLSTKISTDVKPRRGKKYLFSVNNQSRAYLMCAESEDQMRVWLAKIRESLGRERVYHVRSLAPDKLREQDALLQFHRSFLEVIDPVADKSIGRWNVERVRAMGSSGPLFWIDSCARCAKDGDIGGMVYIAIQRGQEAAGQLLKEAQIIASHCCAGDVIVERASDLSCTLVLPGHVKCSGTHLSRATSSASDFRYGGQSSTPLRRTLKRGLSSPTLSASTEQLACVGPQNQHAAVLAQTISRLRSATSSASSSSGYVNMTMNSNVNSPMIRVPYDHAGSCLTLPSPARRSSGSGKDNLRASFRSRSSTNTNSWGRDSGVHSYYGHQLDAFLHDGGSLPRVLRRRTRSPKPAKEKKRSPQPGEVSPIANDDDVTSYKAMGPVSEEDPSSSDSEPVVMRRMSASSAGGKQWQRHSFVCESGYVNMDPLPDSDPQSN